MAVSEHFIPAQDEIEPGHRALIGGSFDPPTLGHLAVYEAGASFFTELRVMVAYNPNKKDFLFSPEDRVKLIGDLAVAEGLRNVSVDLLTPGDLLARYAREEGFSALMRGVRNGIDLDEETKQARENYRIGKGLPTVFMPAINPAHTDIASSWAKAFLGFEDWEDHVKDKLPNSVISEIRALKARQSAAKAAKLDAAFDEFARESQRRAAFGRADLPA